MSTYDVIGVGYSANRRADSRIAQIISREMQNAVNVINVGAGAGSYEPSTCNVVAVEPSMAMIKQRMNAAVPAVRAIAERLPFADGRFDAAMAILTIHHWKDRTQGLREMRRVARETVVILTWDPDHPGFWLVRDYFPEVLTLDRMIFPRLSEVREVLGSTEVVPVLVPHDCMDGFLGAYWRRPERYLDSDVRRSISSFSKVAHVEAGLERLRSDLKSGEWRRRNAALLEMDYADVGYRLVVARRRLQP